MSLKNNVIQGLFWKFLERGGVQIIQFTVSVALARLLTPKDYGLVGIITVFTTICSVFVQSGFNTALIQKKECDEIDYSSVFYFNLLIAISLYCLIFFCAPYVALFYNNMDLVLMLRVFSIILIIQAFSLVQVAILTKKLAFKKIFYSSLLGVVFSGVTGITMANIGLGVWSLVYSSLVNQFVNVIILWMIVDWKPQLAFSISRIKILFKFGSKILISSLINTIFVNIYPLIIGKTFSPDMIGFYNNGRNIPILLVSNIEGSIIGVMFPAFSKLQDDKIKFKNALKRTMKTTVFFIVPVMLGLIATAKPLVIVLFTEKWIPCVPFLQLVCLDCIFWPVASANAQAINASGKSSLYLKLEVIKKSILLVSIFISLPFGIYVLVASTAVVSIIGTIITMIPNGKLFDYGFIEQMKDIIPSIILGLIMMLLVLGIQIFQLNIYLMLVGQIIFGASFYFSVAYFFKIETLTYLLKTIMSP